MKYKINNKVARQYIEDEVFVATPWNSKLHELNPTASKIFRMIEKNFDSEEIIKKMSDIYDAPLEEIKNDFNQLIEKLLEEEIIINV